MLWEPENISITQARPSTQNLFTEGKERGKNKKKALQMKAVLKSGGDAKAEEEGSGDEGQREDSDRLQSVIVSWDDAEIAKYFYR